MYLGTCFGVKMSHIYNKSCTSSLSRLTNEDQKESDEEMLDETARENQLNANALKSLQHALNLRNTAQEKYEFIRHAQLDLCDFYAGIKHHFVQLI
jgi:hypothetical protein